MKKQGFTLVEIFIVIVILGILAAIIIPQFLAPPAKKIVEPNAVKSAQVQADPNAPKPVQVQETAK